MSNSSIQNSTNYAVSGLAINSIDSEIEIINSHFSNLKSIEGPALYAMTNIKTGVNKNVNITGCSFKNNSARIEGGSIVS